MQVWSSPAIVAALVVAAVLAGCTAGNGDGAGSSSSGSLAPPVLAASSTTGVIRGVVVDEAVRPLGNVSVRVQGEGANRTATTGPDGFFGFEGLLPGTWFVVAHKVGHADAQQAVEVQAGVGDPPAVKLLLQSIPGAQPFYNEVKREAFVQCIVPGANLCAIINFYPCTVAGYCQPIVDDTSGVFLYDELMGLQRTPDWYQSELVWESTQAISPQLALRISPHEPADGAGVDERAAAVHGGSPLLFSLDKTNTTAWDMGTKKGTMYEVFGHMQQTEAFGSAGFVVNQRVTFFFHMFYGYTPPAGWRFSETGSVPPPPQ